MSSHEPPSPAPAAPLVELRVFGVPALVVRGLEAPLSLKRAHALLAYLAFHAGPVPRSHLATLLWPDATEGQARARLRRLVYTMEETAGFPLLVAEHDGLALRAGHVQTDALQFARLARRLVAAETPDGHALREARAWLPRARSPLLQGIEFGSEVFDDWLKAVSIEHELLLARLLERMADALAKGGDLAAAIELAEVLIGLDVYREPSYVLLMQLHALQGHSAGVEAAYTRCADALRAEFGIRPGPQTEQAYERITEELRRRWSLRPQRPGVRFAESGRGTIAYTALGSGARALVICTGFVSNIEIALEYPQLRACLDALAERFQVVLFDRSGLGLSERLLAASTPDALAADITAVMDHAGLARAWMFGSSEGSLGTMRLAVECPDRVQGLCLFGALARGSASADYPWALPAAAYDVWLNRLIAAWGGPVGLETFAPGQQDDPALRAWWARLVRHSASPGGLATILGGLRDADLRADLARIRAPTLVMHRRGDRAVRFEAGEHLARTIPGAAWLPLEGADHFWWCGESEAVIEAVLRFAGA